MNNSQKTGIRQAQVDARRNRVADLRRQGYYSKREVAQLLGVSRPTIHRDWEVVDEWWRQRAAEDIGVVKGQIIEGLFDLLKSLTPTATNPGDKNHTWYVDRALKVYEQLRATIGTDAPRKIDLISRLDELGLDSETAAGVVAEAEAILKGRA